MYSPPRGDCASSACIAWRPQRRHAPIRMRRVGRRATVLCGPPQAIRHHTSQPRGSGADRRYGSAGYVDHRRLPRRCGRGGRAGDSPVPGGTLSALGADRRHRAIPRPGPHARARTCGSTSRRGGWLWGDAPISISYPSSSVRHLRFEAHPYRPQTRQSSYCQRWTAPSSAS